MLAFFITLFKITFIQLAAIFGIFFIFGFILSKLQEWTQKKYYQTVSWKGILWTAWLGTPFHEFSHYFFAKIFRHKVQSFHIFKPNQATGELGHLNHTYNKYSLYQNIGNFFIGIAPMIFGSLMLVLLLYLFVPNGRDIFSPLQNINNLLDYIFIGFAKTFINLFNLANLKSWNFWLFLYLSFCIASHLAPSKADRKNMRSGFFYIITALLLINIFSLLFKLDTIGFVLKISKYLGIFSAIFLYATIISIIHFLTAYIILSFINKAKNHWSALYWFKTSDTLWLKIN